MASLMSTKPQLALPVSRRSSVLVQARLTTKGQKATGKQATKGGAYVCADCGYLYPGNDFADLPNSYSCPVCAAPKKRFRQYQGNVSRSNDNKTMATRRDALREQLAARGESVGEDNTFLLVTAAGAFAFLGAFYYFTQ